MRRASRSASVRLIFGAIRHLLHELVICYEVRHILRMMSHVTSEPSPSIPLSHRAIGLAVVLLTAVLRLLPVAVSRFLLDMTVPFLVVGSWIREKRVGRGMNRNLHIAFRDQLTPGMAMRLRWAWARHMTWLFIDFVHMPRIQKENLSRFVDCEDWDRVRAEYERSKGLICVTGHIGVPELLGHVASLLGVVVNGIFRPPGITPVGDYLTGVRSSGGQRVLSKWNVIWLLKKALDRGEGIGLTGDENTAKNPVFVPFLGTSAATNPIPAVLHRATGAPVAVMTVHRRGRLEYRLHVWDVIHIAKTDDRDADIEAILLRINAALSRAIRSSPAQWFWGMRRFHTRPPDEVLGKDGLPPAAHSQGGAPTPEVRGAPMELTT